MLVIRYLLEELDLALDRMEMKAFNGESAVAERGFVDGTINAFSDLQRAVELAGGYVELVVCEDRAAKRGSRAQLLVYFLEGVSEDLGFFKVLLRFSQPGL